jgi:phosphatidylglycerol:prolipoprotein diacylglycerol transferase
MHYHDGTENLVTTFGLLFVLSLAVWWWMARRNAMKIGVDPSHIDLLMPLAIIGGLVGGTLLSIMMPDDRQIAGEVLQIDSRIRLFGLVLSGAVVVFTYSRVTRQSFRKLVDILALPTLAALIVHRVGCFLAGCCWGDISVHDPWLTSIAATEIGQQVQTWPWLAGEWVRIGVTYAPGTFPYEQQVAIGLIGSDAVQSLPVHPVQLYEAAMLGVFLLLFRKTAVDKYPAGTIALITAGGYAVIRFVMEYLRADSSLVFGALTATQLQCIALLVLAGGLCMISLHAAHNQRI